MAEPLNLQQKQSGSSNHGHEPAVGFASRSSTNFSADVSAFQRIDTSGAELATRALRCIQLPIENLDCFEVLDKQYEQLGVTFCNAVAVQPSNPAFPPHNGHNLLMGSPKSGWLEATFVHPVECVSSLVTSSSLTTVLGFDDANQLVAEAKISGPNLATSNASEPPNTQVTLSAKNIRRVAFRTVGGQLTLGGFSFSLSADTNCN